MAGTADATIVIDGDFTPFQRQQTQAFKTLESSLARIGRTGKKAIKPLGEGLSAATADASEFEKSLKAANARVLAFGASAGLIIKVQQGLASLVKSTIQVEKTLKDVNVILNASNKNLDQFRRGLFQVARETGQTFETVAEAATELSRQGLSAAETLKRTRDALILTRLSGLDAVSSVEALTATLNTFNKTGLTSTTVINKMAKVDAAFAVSSRDLAEALKRVGASAQGANVQFDELLAVVTATQQKTARGGAVIGNSFKTIFTRIQRPELLNQLESLGIAVRNIQGETLPAMQILTNLAKRFKTLTESQRSNISEQTAGVFQINVLKAVLSDLNEEYSIYNQALRSSKTATNEAIDRSKELNTTLATLLNRTTESFKAFSASVGEVSLAPTMRNALENISGILEAGTVTGPAETTGEKFGKGLLEGLGKFIGGPGAALAGIIGGKLIVGFLKFSKEAFNVLVGQNTLADQRKKLQQGILNLISQEPAILEQVRSGHLSIRDASQLVVNTLRDQERLLVGNAQIANEVAAIVGKSGVVSVKGDNLTLTKKGKGKAEGYVPNFANMASRRFEEASARSLGAPANVKAHMSAGTIGGKKFLMNNKEVEIPRFGKNGDSAVIPTYSEGHIPNFALSQHAQFFGRAFGPRILDVGTFDRKFRRQSSIIGQFSQKSGEENVKKTLTAVGRSEIINASVVSKLLAQRGFNIHKTVQTNKIPGTFGIPGGGGENFPGFDSFIHVSKGANNYAVPIQTKGGGFGNVKNLEKGHELGIQMLSGLFRDQRFLRQHNLPEGIQLAPGFLGLNKQRLSGPELKHLSEIEGSFLNLKGFAAGNIPNFSPLSSSIGREIAAGIPPSKVRVGSHPSLKSGKNPGGIGVYNTIDEPRGLIQGINRVRSQGGNPKSSGIPNFISGAGITRSHMEVDLTSRFKALKAQEKNTKALEKNTDTGDEMARMMASAGGGRLLGGIFATQLALETVGQFAPGKVQKGLSGALQFGTAGAISGSVLGGKFGPHAAVIGGLGGAIFGLVRALNPLTNALEGLQRASENLNNQFAKIQSSGENLRSGLAALRGAKTPEARSLAQSRIQEGFTTASPAVQQMLLTGGGNPFRAGLPIEERFVKAAEIQAKEQFKIKRRKKLVEAVRAIPTLDEGSIGKEEMRGISSRMPSEVLENIKTFQKTIGVGKGGVMRKDVVDAQAIEKYFLELGLSAETAKNARTAFEKASHKQIEELKNSSKETEKLSGEMFSLTSSIRSAEQEMEKKIIDLAPTIIKSQQEIFTRGLRNKTATGGLAREASFLSATEQDKINFLSAAGGSRQDILEAQGSFKLSNLRRKREISQQSAVTSFDEAFGAGMKATKIGLAEFSIKQAAASRDLEEYSITLLNAETTTDKQKEVVQGLLNQLETIKQKRSEEIKDLDNQEDILRANIEAQRKILEAQTSLANKLRGYEDSIGDLTRRNQKNLNIGVGRAESSLGINQAIREAGFERGNLGLGPSEIFSRQAGLEAAGRKSEDQLRRREFKIQNQQIEKELKELGIDLTKDKPTTPEEGRKFERARELTEQQKELNNQYQIENELFKINEQTQKEINKIRTNAIKEEISLRGTLHDIMSEFAMSDEAIQADLSKNMLQMARNMKSEFAGAFDSFIEGANSAEDAFRQFGLSISRQLSQLATQYLTNQLFSSVGEATLGLFQKKARGGMVMGGSGTRDDVPAMLTGGEYVVRKSAVDALGVGFLENINKFADGGLVLPNEFQLGTKGSKGKFNVSSRLSSMALTDPNNPQNALRQDLFAQDIDRIQRFEEYQLAKRNALAAFKNQKRQRRIGGIIQSVGILGLSALQNRGGEQKGVDTGREHGPQNRPSGPTPFMVPPSTSSRNQGGSMSTQIAPIKPMGGGGDGLGALAESISMLSATVAAGRATTTVEDRSQATNNVNITINVDKNGNAKASQEKDGNKLDSNSANENDDVEKQRELGRLIEGVVLQTLVQETRPGGLLNN